MESIYSYNITARNTAIKVATMFNNLAYKINMDALRYGIIDGAEWKIRADRINLQLEDKLKQYYKKR